MRWILGILNNKNTLILRVSNSKARWNNKYVQIFSTEPIYHIDEVKKKKTKKSEYFLTNGTKLD